jgi:hypothetical protein
MPRYIPHSEAELHYSHLIKFFKWLLSISLAVIALIITVAGLLMYKNVQDIVAEVRSEIQRARISAEASIDTVRKRAEQVAIAEAHARVEEAFKSTNVIQMVETAAKRQTGTVIERQVANEVSHYLGGLHDEISSLGVLADNAMRMRLGLREGLNNLKRITKTGSKQEQERASGLLESISRDYDSVSAKVVGLERRKFVEEQCAIWNIAKDIRGPKLTGVLIAMAHTETDLNSLALLFQMMRINTGVLFKMFDIDEIDRWCTNHPAECGK